MDTTLELVGLIYDGVADASRWPRFLGALVDATHATMGSLALFSEVEGGNIVCWYGWKDEDYPLYMQRYCQTDPWIEPLRTLPEGMVGTSEDLCSREVLEASTTYREFYAPRGCHYGCGAAILRTARVVSLVVVARDSTIGAFGEREKSVLRPLVTHLRRAALLHGEMASLRSQLTAFSGHLDRYPQAFLIIDADCRLVYVNSAARETLARSDGFVVEAGRLRLDSAKEDAAMRVAVRAIAGERATSHHTLEVSRSSARKPYRLVLLPLPDSGVVPLGVMPPVAAALIIDADSATPPDAAMLRELFCLTPAEARLTGLLVAGYSLEEAAAKLCVSLETIRTHTRRVFSKTATKRQGELISLVLRSVPFGQVVGAGTGRRSPAPVRDPL